MTGPRRGDPVGAALDLFMLCCCAVGAALVVGGSPLAPWEQIISIGCTALWVLTAASYRRAARRWENRCRSTEELLAVATAARPSRRLPPSMN